MTAAPIDENDNYDSQAEVVALIEYPRNTNTPPPYCPGCGHRLPRGPYSDLSCPECGEQGSALRDDGDPAELNFNDD